MKTLPVLSRVLLAIIFTMTLMGSSILTNLAFAQGCPQPENILNFSDCASCRTDLNNDGKTTTSDLLLLERCLKQPGDCNNLAYDVNGDGVVNEVDAGILRACISKSLINRN
jgi:hypothetical protein